MTKAERSVTPEVRRLRHPEYRLTRQQLSTLVHINPGTDILNRTLLNRKFGKAGESFDPDRFDLPQVVWVQVAPNRKELLIEDGHHRSHVVDANWDTIQGKHAGFEFRVRDVTDFYISKRTDAKQHQDTSPSTRPLDQLVVEASAQQDPPALTIEEYLEALVGPTAEQPEVASLRVAVTLMKTWEGMLASSETAEKFSALSAFSFLEGIENGLTASTREKRVHTLIDGHKSFFKGEDPGDVVAIRRGLHRMHDIMSGTKVKPKQVAQAATFIMSSKPESIGGATQVEKQVAGLLYTHDIQRKFEDEFGTGAGRDRALQRVASVISDNFQKRSTRREVQSSGLARTDIVRFREIMLRALLHPRISINQFLEIITTEGTSTEVEAKYRHVLTDNIQDVLTSSLTQRSGGAEVTEAESIVVGVYAQSLAYESGIVITPTHLRLVGEHAAYARVLFESASRLVDRIQLTPELDKTAADRILQAREKVVACSNPSLFGRLLSEMDSVIHQETTQIRMVAALQESPPRGQTGFDVADMAGMIDVYVSLSPGLQRQVRNGSLTFADAVAEQRRRDDARPPDSHPNLSPDVQVGDRGRVRETTGPIENEVSPDPLQRVQAIKTLLGDIPAEDVVGPVRDEMQDVLLMVLDRLDPTGETAASLTSGIASSGTVFEHGGPGSVIIEVAGDQSGVVPAVESKEQKDLVTVDQIDERARSMFGLDEARWDSVLCEIIQGEQMGTEVIDATLTDRVNNILGVVNDPSGHPLTLASPEINVMIAEHYLEFMTKPTPLKGSMLSRVIAFVTEHKLPPYREFRDVLKILLYTEPDDIQHNKAAEFISSKVRKEDRAHQIIAGFLRERDYRHIGRFVKEAVGLDK